MDKGFTLIEVLIALAVSGILMVGVYTAFQIQQESYRTQDQVAEMQQNIRAGLDFVVRELRMAGYDPDNLGSAGISAANANSITFSFVADDDATDNDGDGTVDEIGELATISYDHYDANTDGLMDVGRQVGGTKRAVAENIEQIEFYYTLADGTQTTTPTATQLDDIRSIEISILAMTDRPDGKYLNSQSYASASGVDWTPAAADNFRRRFQTMRVQCRNMGL